jgi:hypothetical protein
MEELDAGEKLTLALLITAAFDTTPAGWGADTAGILYVIADKLELRDQLRSVAQYLGRMDALRAAAKVKPE